MPDPGCADHRRSRQSTRTLLGMDSDDVACAIRLNAEAQLRLRKAAGISLVDIYEDEFPEPDTRHQTRSLTDLEFDDLVKEGEIISRRPYRCTVCGGTFTIDQYHRIQHQARIIGEPNPFTAGRAVHEECSSSIDRLLAVSNSWAAVIPRRGIGSRWDSRRCRQRSR